MAKLAKVCLQLFFWNFQFQTVHRSIGLHRSAVYRLRMTADHSSFHAKFENIAEHGFEDLLREQLPRSANGRVPRQILVDVVTQKEKNVQTHSAMLNELTVAGKVLQISHKTEFEKHHGIDALLAAITIEILGMGI